MVLGTITLFNFLSGKQNFILCKSFNSFQESFFVCLSLWILKYDILGKEKKSNLLTCIFSSKSVKKDVMATVRTFKSTLFHTA